ncbi:putative serine/threonine-protein kinase receptor [Hordeum vulgare]|nr:putative serine/threonine-protein kinase receptor [Hordeum vulgare]
MIARKGTGHGLHLLCNGVIASSHRKIHDIRVLSTNSTPSIQTSLTTASREITHLKELLGKWAAEVEQRRQVEEYRRHVEEENRVKEKEEMNKRFKMIEKKLEVVEMTPLLPLLQKLNPVEMMPLLLLKMVA